MLTKDVVMMDVLFIKVASLLAIFPITVDLKELKIYEIRNSFVKKYLHYFVLVAVAVRQFYGFVVVVRKMSEGTLFDEFNSLLFACWIMLVVTLILNIQLYHVLPTETVLLFNSLEYPDGDEVTENGEHSSDSGRVKLLLSFVRVQLGKFVQYNRRFMKLSVREKVVANSVGSCLGIIPFTVGAMLVFPEWELYPYSIVPAEHRSTLVFTVLLLWEILSLTFISMQVGFGLYLGMATRALRFEYMETTFRMERLREEKRLKPYSSLQESLNKMRIISLHISLVNMVAPVALFAGKVMSFSNSIVGTYVVIRSIQTSPAMAFWSASIAGTAVVFYLYLAGDLYKASVLMKDAKLNLMLVHGRRGGTSLKKEYLDLWLESVSEKGIIEMGNRPFDNLTVLLYVEYYVNQVISLLLAA